MAPGQVRIAARASLDVPWIRNALLLPSKVGLGQSHGSLVTRLLYWSLNLLGTLSSLAICKLQTLEQKTFAKSEILALIQLDFKLKFSNFHNQSEISSTHVQLKWTAQRS